MNQSGQLSRRSQKNRDLVASGKAAELLAEADGSLLKLYWPNTLPSVIEIECRVLVRVAAAGLPTPRLLGREERNGRLAIRLSRIDGQTMLADLIHRPFRAQAGLNEMARLHAAIHRLDGRDLPNLKKSLRRRINRAGLPAEMASRLMEHFAALPAEEALCHGDFHFENLILGPDGLVIIDWDKACQAAPAADVAQTLIQILYGDYSSRLPTPFVRLGRRLLALLYRRAYLKAAGSTVAAAEIDDWLPVLAAAKLPSVENDLRPEILSAISRWMMRC